MFEVHSALLFHRHSKSFLSAGERISFSQFYYLSTSHSASSGQIGTDTNGFIRRARKSPLRREWRRHGECGGLRLHRAASLSCCTAYGMTDVLISPRSGNRCRFLIPTLGREIVSDFSSSQVLPFLRGGGARSTVGSPP